MFTIENPVNAAMSSKSHHWFWVFLDCSGLPRRLSGKESDCNAGATEALGSSPGLGRSPEEETATHSCSCLENPRDRGAWRAAVHGVTESQHDCSDLAQTVCSNRDPNRVRSALHWTHLSLLIYMFLLSLPYNIFVNKFG